MINYAPTPLLNGKSPYEILLSRKPNYSHLKAFGCLCYASVIPRSSDKFSERANPCIFIGYPYGQKGYRVYNLTTHRIIVSRDVVFHETIFPFQSYSPTKSSILSPILVSIIEPDIIDHHEQGVNKDGEIDLVDRIDENNTTNELPQNNIDDERVVDNDNTTNTSQYRNDQATISHDLPNLVPIAITHPTRQRKMPAHFKDYIVELPGNNKDTSQSHANTVSSGTSYPLSHYLSYSHFSSQHRCFLAAISTNDEPTSYTQAIKDTRW